MTMSCIEHAIHVENNLYCPDEKYSESCLLAVGGTPCLTIDFGLSHTPLVYETLYTFVIHELRRNSVNVYSSMSVTDAIFYLHDIF